MVTLVDLDTPVKNKLHSDLKEPTTHEVVNTANQSIKISSSIPNSLKPEQIQAIEKKA